MLQTNIMDRGTGKTNKVILTLVHDLDAIAVVSLSTMKEAYPKMISDRILTINDIMNDELDGMYFSQIIIDEGFIFEKEKLAHLYYKLGQIGAKTIVYGTINR